MKVKDIKWKFIAAHSVAATFMILAGRQFYILYDIRIVEAFYLFGSDMDKVGQFIFKSSDESFSDLVINYHWGRVLVGLLGLLISSSLSWFAAVKSNINKINILFILLIGLSVSVLVSRSHFDFHHIIPLLTDVIDLIGIRIVFATNVVLLVSIALLLHLNKNLKKYFYQQGI
jgi:hypothetical protein